MKKLLLSVPIILTIAFAFFITGLFVGRHNADGIPLAPNPSTETPQVSNTASTLKMNINTATAEDLATLPGIGDALAQRIIAYREENGDYYTIYELEVVSGIGKGKIENLKDLITAE